MRKIALKVHAVCGVSCLPRKRNARSDDRAFFLPSSYSYTEQTHPHLNPQLEVAEIQCLRGLPLILKLA